MYTEFCDAFFSWIENFTESTESESIYIVLEEAIENVILDYIGEGVKNGTISLEDWNKLSSR